MNKYLSELAKNIVPYTPGEQPKDKQYIKLNTNENPYPPSKRVLDKISDSCFEDLKLYPDPNSNSLRSALSKYHNVKESNIFVGNGSDEVLAFAFAAFYKDKQICFPSISYSFYPVYCQLYNIKAMKIEMKNLKIDVESFLNKKKGIIIANPNAPTGELLSLKTIEIILKSNTEDVVIIDEAYIDFGGESAISLINKYENLLVVQTFSKSRSLAGMRIGVAYGNELLIDGLNRIKNSFNSYPVDRISQVIAVESIKDDDYFLKVCNNIINTRVTTTKILREKGFDIEESYANFIFAKHSKISGETLYKKLKEKGILVRFFNKAFIDNYVRITIGTKEEMDKLINAIDNIIKD